MTKTTKILLGVLLVVLLIAGYTYLGPDESDSSLPSLQPALPSGLEEETATGQKFLTVLLRLKELNIDRKIFDDPAFISLKDFGVVLTPEPPGRPNPFAPLGQGGFSYSGNANAASLFQSGANSSSAAASSTANSAASVRAQGSAVSAQQQTIQTQVGRGGLTP